MLLVDGSSLTLDAIGAVAAGRVAVGLAPEARRRVEASRAVVDRVAGGPAAVYGVNTGFGSFADVRIEADALDALQVNLLRSHAAGVGDPLPVPAVRAMMLLRANVLASGHSGIRATTLDALLALLDRRRPSPRPIARVGGRKRRPGAARAPGARAHRRGRGALGAGPPVRA